MQSVTAGRWPPVYDSESLAATIAELLTSRQLLASFYSATVEDPLGLCQGDVLAFESPMLAVNEDGKPVVLKFDDVHWLVLTNTCDLDRRADGEHGDSTYATVVPVFNWGGRAGMVNPVVRDLERYAVTRRFYLPPWAPEQADNIFVAVLTMPLSVHKKALVKQGRVCARLSQNAWYLLHSCLVRLLARDDGRFG
jgi:hypothetical protein